MYTRRAPHLHRRPDVSTSNAVHYEHVSSAVLNAVIWTLAVRREKVAAMSVCPDLMQCFA